MKFQVSVLENINSSSDVKQLNSGELLKLCDEIREFLINKVSSTGGHLASNLGAVELTVALHKVFDFDKDKIVFDVGHQSYVHKILTGRKEEFDNLRKLGGISGFPKVRESKYDFFDTGHSSDSLSVAIGLKRASRLMNEKRNVIAFIGDGSFSGGMVYEAMNDAGNLKKDNIIVILNDNGMSISKNGGSISKHFRKVRISSSYIKTKKRFKNKLAPSIMGVLRKIKNSVRKLVVGETIFENLGFAYYGPFDGHNINELIKIFENAKYIDKPVVLHIKTKKGKGYSFAEENPEVFHGVSGFDINTGVKNKTSDDYSSVFGKALLRLAEKDEKIVAVTAAMPSGTGLSSFAEKFPERFFDVGICEQHAVSLCGGMAAGGLKPVFAVYSTFLQRGFDQLITDVALMNLKVVFCIDRAGIVGADGETHQGVFDISYIRSIPNFTLMSPASFEELELMLDYAVNNINGPVAIRYPRGKEGIDTRPLPIEYKKSEKLFEGKDITLIAEGRMVLEAVKIKEILEAENISSEVINLRFLNPLDETEIKESVLKTKKAVILENGVSAGGIGESISALLKNTDVKIILKNIPDVFLEHGSIKELMEKTGLDANSVAKDIKKELF